MGYRTEAKLRRLDRKKMDGSEEEIYLNGEEVADIFKQTPYRNSTRIASLNGVWSMELIIKTDVGGAKVKAWYVLNLLCDPMIQHGCGIQDDDNSTVGSACDMLHKNEICIREGNSTTYNFTCGNMQTDISDWSDAVMLYHLGYQVDVPGYHQYEDTGRFVGHFTLTFPQMNVTEYNQTHEEPEGRRYVDIYTTRYVNSVYSNKIYMPQECDVFNYKNFEQLGGQEALNWTIHYQRYPPEFDVYEPYLDTCDNGNANPIMPLFTFLFSRSTKPPFDEIIDFDLKYKLFVAPSDSSGMEFLKGLGLPIDGPYCFNGELKGYTFDFSFNSIEGNDYVQYEHACIEGEPCLSLAYSKCSLCSDIEVRESNGGTTIQVGILIWLILSITFIGSFFICSIVNNIKNRKRIRLLEIELNTVGDPSRNVSDTYDLIANENDVVGEGSPTEPLISLVNADDISLNTNASHPLSFRPKEPDKKSEDFTAATSVENSLL